MISPTQNHPDNENNNNNNNNNNADHPDSQNPSPMMNNHENESNSSSSCAICYCPFSTTQSNENSNNNNNKNNNNNSITTTLPTIIPCCERDSSSTKFCFRCIELLCQHSSHGENIGRCPRCRTYIQATRTTSPTTTIPNATNPTTNSNSNSNSNSNHNSNHNNIQGTIQIITQLPKRYKCQMCQQSFPRDRIHIFLLGGAGPIAGLVPGLRQRQGPRQQNHPHHHHHHRSERILCHACFIGVQNPLRYECNNCSHIQSIHHPMYRYQQPSPQDFSNITWACRGCGRYTHWRVISNDYHRIPIHDVPESWNWNGNNALEDNDDDPILAVRRIRQNEEEEVVVAVEQRRNRRNMNNQRNVVGERQEDNHRGGILIDLGAREWFQVLFGVVVGSMIVMLVMK